MKLENIDITYEYISTNPTEKKLNLFKNANENIIFAVTPENGYKIPKGYARFSNFCYDEKEHFEKLKNLIELLNTYNKPYTLSIDVINRELFEQSNILKLYPNINFIIVTDEEPYTKDEYINEEEKLNALVKPIKESNLSPYEKFIAVYNIVKQFKPYKLETTENEAVSRKLKYILNNEFIVCAGFQKLLKALLDKIGIPSISVNVSTTTNYKENQGSKPNRHAKNIVKIDDDKYDIHGIYIVDSTWDNSLDYDLYTYINLTFDEIKEGSYIEKLENFDLLLDFHNPKEFSEKINHYIKKMIKNSYYELSTEKIIEAYSYLFYEIMHILSQLDYNKYIYFFNKYNNYIPKIAWRLPPSISNINLKELDELFSNFLTEYLKYIIPISNNKIDNETLYEAIKEVKRVIKNYNKHEINYEMEEIEFIHKNRKERIFPYSYDPNNEIPNYLETKKR